MRGILFLVLAGCSVPDKFLVDGGAGSDAADDSMIDSRPSGEFVWARSMSGMGTFGVASGGSSIVVVGGLITSADLGGGMMTSQGATDLVVASFGAEDAAHQYSVRHGTTGVEQGFLDVTDTTGLPIVYGLTGGTPYDLGMGATATAGQADAYIGRYGPNAPTWLQRVFGTLDDKMITSARGTGSSIWGGGWFEGTATFNAATINAIAGRDIFLGRFNSFTGQCDLAKTWGTMNREEASGSWGLPGNGLILTGFFDNAINATDHLSFGGTAAPLTSAGALDVFVTKLDANGVGVWAVNLGGTGDERDSHLTVDAAGDIYIQGGFTGSFMLGTTRVTSVGGFDVFLAKLSGVDGHVIWATSWGGSGDDGQRGISVDARDRLIISGASFGSVDGAPTLGGFDGVIAEYDAMTGALVWRKIISTAGDDRGGANVFGVNGDNYFVINLGGAYDWGVPLIGPAAPVSALVRITP